MKAIFVLKGWGRTS
ncbi:trp operon leader peptide [Escherichia coli]|nr:trp operon leader peptide [Escherichia coli]EHP8243077.1 trp operon leader peptide [Escherichia coli]